jgi:hypothetical protein
MKRPRTRTREGRTTLAHMSPAPVVRVARVGTSAIAVHSAGRILPSSSASQALRVVPSLGLAMHPPSATLVLVGEALTPRRGPARQPRALAS